MLFKINNCYLDNLYEIYKKETLINIINHFNYYPLLGEKANSLQKFKLKIY